MSSLSSLVPLVASTGRAGDVVRRISEAIHLGLLEDGEKLPAEPDLAAQFGVAPMTVREALASLRDQGLVTTRRGRSGGSFVSRPSAPAVEPIRNQLAQMTVSELRDLSDEHRAVAGECARLAAERASAVNVRRLFSLTEQLGAARTLGERIRADCRFHIEIAVAAQSARLTRREVRLQAEDSGMLWLPIGPEVDVSEHVAAHHEMASGIVAEKASHSRELAERHIDEGLRRVTTLHLLLTAEGRAT